MCWSGVNVSVVWVMSATAAAIGTKRRKGKSGRGKEEHSTVPGRRRQTRMMGMER